MLSQIFLDLLNFFVGPLGGGAGAYVAFYFASIRHWSASSIGLALAIMTLSLGLAQTPAGLLIDRLSRRTEIVALALLVMTISWSILLLNPSLPIVLAAQVLVGIASAIFTPAIASVSLSLVGHEKLDIRVGRNATFCHAGNVCMAMAIGLAGHLQNSRTILYLLISFCLLALISSLMIKRTDTTNFHLSSTNNCINKLPTLLSAMSHLVTNRKLCLLAIAGLFYTFANATMLPLMVQLICRSGGLRDVSMYLPACLLLTEFVMIPTCFLASRMTRFGRKPLLLLSFILLAMRGASFAFTKDPNTLVAWQIVDGISAGIFGLITTLAVADLCRGTNMFSTTLSALATIMTVTSSASEYISGLIAGNFGFSTAFLVLASVSTLGCIFAMSCVKETLTPAVSEIQTDSSEAVLLANS